MVGINAPSTCTFSDNFISDVYVENSDGSLMVVSELRSAK